MAGGRPKISGPTTHPMWGEQSCRPPWAMIERSCYTFDWVEILFPRNQKDTRYCTYHRRNGHMLEQFVTFRKIFNEKHKVGDILFYERVVSINDLPFPKNNDKDKGPNNNELACGDGDQRTATWGRERDWLAEQICFKTFLTIWILVQNNAWRPRSASPSWLVGRFRPYSKKTTFRELIYDNVMVFFEKYRQMCLVTCHYM